MGKGFAVIDVETTGFSPEKHDRIVEVWESLLAGLGFDVRPNVVKKTKVLVAADPDSLSGKAKKAREYGIPIVNEAGLERLLGL